MIHSGHYLVILPSLTNVSSHVSFVNIFLIPATFAGITSLLLFLPKFLMIIWITNIDGVFNSKNARDKLSWAEHCIDLYEKLEKYLGIFQLCYLAVGQVSWIVSFFFVISLGLEHKGEWKIENLMHSIGEFQEDIIWTLNKTIGNCWFLGSALFSAGYLLQLKLFIFHNDLTYRSFKSIKHVIKKVKFEDKESLERAEDIIDTIEDAEPLSGCGMFQITRSTLTSMIATSITYLIVLVQFKMSEP